MLSWLKRKAQNLLKKPKQKQSPTRSPNSDLSARRQQTRKNTKAKYEHKKAQVQKQYALRQNDKEVVAKYVTKRSEKAAFAEALGEKRKKTTRLAIPRTILINGVTFSKYANYESDREGAEEAANDMTELGYRTKIVRHLRGDEPVFVVYRYKKGRTSNEIAAQKRKTTAKRTIRSKRKA